MARQYTINSPQGSAPSGIDYAKELNAEQHAAVTSPQGPALVIAGAGSGKTRVLTYRVAYLLDKGIDPKNLLLLTFTNKAAKEMMERARQLVPRDLSALWSGTFHSIGNRILRRHADELGLTSSFSILDRDDQKSTLNSVIAEAKIDTKTRRFPKADVLASIFSLHQNTGESIHDIILERYTYFEEWLAEIELVFTNYGKKKIDTNSADFDDLLLLPLQLLENDEDLCRLYQKRFQFILVDEYQDTNHIQSRLIDLLSKQHNSLMVVGDDAQSIYSWRGADMDHILSFSDRFPDAKTYTIETNYRSVPQVLELSNAAISVNTKQFKKNLRAHRPDAPVLPALVPLETPSAQAQFIAQRILELREEGIELDEMAILYRAHHQSLEIQMELTSRDIPFQITSGLRFFEQAHIKDVAAFLRFIANPKDEVSFKRFCGLLPGVGPVSAAKLWTKWLGTEHAQNATLPPKFSDLFLTFPIPKKATKFWEQLAYTLDELAPDGEPARPSDMIFSVVEGLYEEYLQQNFDNADQRRQDLEQFSLYSEKFDKVEELLSELSLLTQMDDGPSGTGKNKKQPVPDEEQLTLSSIHQAKGLEWKVVFIVWLTEGSFPNGRIIESDDPDQLEEERRLFYVALTRAKDELYLSYPMLNPKSYTGDSFQTPSRFLDDCPQDLLETWQVNSNPW